MSKVFLACTADVGTTRPKLLHRQGAQDVGGFLHGNMLSVTCVAKESDMTTGYTFDFKMFSTPYLS